jgi:integrase
MNVRDICELKHTSVEGKNIFYVRAKTKNTKKKKVIKQVPVTKSIAEIIKRQKDKDSDYLFGIIDSKDNPKAVHEKIRNFNKFINKHFREFAISAGIDEIIASKFGTYHARHSFATIAVRKGNSMELISEILHDGNIRTTQSYLNSFPKETFQELSKELEIIL